jgi:hypothetical protein
VSVPTLMLVSFLDPTSGKICSGSVVSHKIGLLSIGQNPRDLKRGQPTRSTAVLGHLDATTAILESKDKLARRVADPGDHSSRSRQVTTVLRRIACRSAGLSAKILSILSAVSRAFGEVGSNHAAVVHLLGC